MSVTTHIAEVIRQGIWASLTGGWYYEPSYSIFCNTVHVYVWLILMVVPLLLGIFASGSISVGTAVAYTGFIVFLFTFIKVSISYFHMIFDTTDPIVVTRTINDSIEEMFRDSEQNSEQNMDIEMIELRDMGYNLRGSERALDRDRSRDRESSGGRHQGTASASSSRRVRIEDENSSAAQADDKSDIDSKIKEAENEDEEDIEDRSEPTLAQRNSSSGKMSRKGSEPVMTQIGSSVDVLEKRRSSVPCGIFYIGTNEKEDDDDDDEIDIFAENKKEEEIVETADEPKPSTSVQEIASSTARRRPSRRRSSVGTTGRRRATRRAGSPAVFPGALVRRDESSRSVPSRVGWTPVVVSLRDLSRPSTSRYSGDDEENGSDIKGEITKFLEELIDKHPETLDAIESVRMNRLGQQQLNCAREPSALEAIPQRSARRVGPPLPGWNSNSTSDRYQHIALIHEDTTQGAVHSFQDENGTWWTYTFDENGVGVAQPLGTGQALMELLHKKREKSTEKKPRPGELEVLPESMYDSTEDEKNSDEEDSAERVDEEQQPSTSKEPIPMTRRERALSSSSNESCTYMPPIPSSVFHAPSGSGATRLPSNRGNQIVCFSNASTRLRAALRNEGTNNDDNSDASWHMEQIMELIENSHNNRREANRVETLAPPNERLLHMDSASTSTGPSSRFRLLSELAFAGMPQNNPMSTPDFAARRSSNIRKSYYYQMKMFPKAQKTFNLKLDRPSVDRLFDRNRGIWSLLFDVLLAAFVSFLAACVINADIYFDLGVLFFAIVVASAHFSLLKSVQPDASSPIHGFNWVVSYSRPIYFCIFAGLLLYLHHLAGGKDSEDVVPWNWNPYRLHLMSSTAVVLAFRDFAAFCLLFMPVAFTFGWLPQVNTLFHHILEQFEMHIFGGTASFGVFSAIMQMLKSAFVYAILASLCHVAFTFSPNSTQSPIFSSFIAVTIALSYVLSRISSNQNLTIVLFEILLTPFRRADSSRSSNCADSDENGNASSNRFADEMPRSIRRTIGQRARYDVIFTMFLVMFFFALHSTFLFTATQPYFTKTILTICVVIGVVNHYLYHQLRSHTPWKLISQPILRSAEHAQFESPDAAKLMIFEIIHMWMVAIERNILYPLMVCSVMTENNWSLPYPWLLYPLISMRLLRGGFAQPQLMCIPIGFAFLASAFDLRNLIGLNSLISKLAGKNLNSWSLLPIVMYVCVLVYPKLVEFYLKINFVLVYVAPWQISWGSAFHAFAQPFSVPHSALIGLQTAFASIISAPLNPFLGSSFFTASYVRPIKFWERDYNTKRADASNMRLASQLDRGPMIDDSNLNAVFYEHLTRSLQKSLAGDLAMGRWSTSVQPGDCFILASFYLNCLVHIIEVGNGFITFQLRGLEFRGTYCHQREVEAISEDIRDGTGCCCCSPGALPGFLSLNTAWGLRWLAWEVVSGKYIIDGYSISDNSAVNLLQVHELRRLLVTLYVQCIIYYAVNSKKMMQWIENEMIASTIRSIMDNPKYTDLDSTFCSTNDEDYDPSEAGISRTSFAKCYSTWVEYCLARRAQTHQGEYWEREDVICFCYLLSLVARRSLATAAYNRHSNAAESFLYGLHALFKGDFRITCQRDEWVFSDMDLLRCVVAPAVKMALKLHQDHFTHFEEFDDHESLYNVIGDHQTKMFISHEQDPGWRNAILANTPSLLALRHVYDDGQDDYKIIMLNKMHLNMRVIKLNRECVRAFWAGQQQELIFLRNRNPERGSIQNARQVLRNMINSSADQPVGYPIYVSPLTTSHVESHSQIENVFGPTFSFEGLLNFGRNVWQGILSHLDPSVSTSVNQQSTVIHLTPLQPPIRPSPQTHRSTENEEDVHMENSIVEMTKDGARVSVLQRRDTFEPATPPPPPTPQQQQQQSGETPAATTSKLAHMLRTVGGLSEDREMSIGAWVQIVDEEQIFKFLNEPLKSTGECLVVWPEETIQRMSGRAAWLYQPVKGMCGRIVYTWHPNHPIRAKRSHVGDYIHLIAIPSMTNGLVPVAEKGCRLLTPSECAIQGAIGTTTAEHIEYMNRVNDVLVLAQVVPGTLSTQKPMSLGIEPTTSDS
ncbi:unnamed protein product [Caenorhabditis bovis]|uniref:Pecanex-like protein n=1 Tax=Caenorhabditis bovis TaxID=2654633 RepID=A0A8S1FD27_9PELO|nr:unnamed protein product [Caenorhabditis bovis]